jgi:hypothetical protein
VLDACLAGSLSNGIASQVADQLNTNITAPIAYIWYWTPGLIADDTIGAGSYNKNFTEIFPGLGTQVPRQTFGPDGSPTAKSPTPPGF